MLLVVHCVFKRDRYYYFMQLSFAQFDRLSEMFSNLSLVILAALVIPAFVDIDSSDPLLVLFGVVLFVMFNIISLLLIEFKNE